MWLIWASTLQSAGFLPAVSPYDLPPTGLDHFRDLLTRRVDFGLIEPDLDGAQTQLLIGAVDVLSGQFRAFDSRRERIVPDMILASAAIPTVFPTVHVDGGAFWDGLFSQNPPVQDLLDSRPDELWVIQINPTARADEPKTVLDITDRRNELSGNLSLYQELHGIEVIDRLLRRGSARRRPVQARHGAHPGVRPPALVDSGSARPPSSTATPGSSASSWRWASSRPRSSSRCWRSSGPGARARTSTRVLAVLAPDVELSSTAPFRPRDGLRGDQARTEVAELCTAVKPGPHPQAAHPRTGDVDGPAGRRTGPPRPGRGGDRRRPRDAAAARPLVMGLS